MPPEETNQSSVRRPRAHREQSQRSTCISCGPPPFPCVREILASRSLSLVSWISFSPNKIRAAPQFPYRRTQGKEGSLAMGPATQLPAAALLLVATIVQVRIFRPSSVHRQALHSLVSLNRRWLQWNPSPGSSSERKMAADLSSRFISTPHSISLTLIIILSAPN